LFVDSQKKKHLKNAAQALQEIIPKLLRACGLSQTAQQDPLLKIVEFSQSADRMDGGELRNIFI
jgi:hypothetical protein